jgi:hypothetical protein
LETELEEMKKSSPPTETVDNSSQEELQQLNEELEQLRKEHDRLTISCPSSKRVIIPSETSVIRQQAASADILVCSQRSSIEFW